MDTSKIGNARQQDDNRVAVMKAKGLGDCWLELRAILETAELQLADYQPDQMAMYRSMQPDPDSSEGQAWIKACIMSDKATDTLRQAVATGDLPIWRIHEAREVLLAPAVLERENVKYGIFKSFERPEPEMQGARLWVKIADWTAFLERSVIPDPSSAVLPPDEQFVTLSEALTWGAFGVSMNSDVLHNVLSLDSYGTVIPQEALKTATARLLKLANEGKVAMRGKYRASHQIELRTLLTDTIDSIKFADFSQFNYLHDELKHGDGLWAWKEPSGVIRSGNRRGGRPDSYCHVSVSREDLLRAFPRQVPHTVDRSKQHDFATEALPQREIEQASGIQGEWLLCFQAVRQLHQVLKEAVGDADSAPWVTTAEWHENLQTLKWNARTGLTFRRALLAGDLKAYFLKDGAEQLVPGWAWENDGAAAEAMHMIALPIDPFLDFTMASDMRTYIRRTELDSWLQRDGIASTEGLPVLPQPYDIGSKPVAIRYSEPSDKPFVDLTEAVTWAAFNIAMSRDVFMIGEHYRFGPFASENYAATINDAVIKLIDHASGGSIRVRGRSVKRYFDDCATERADTTDLSDNALRDFGRFDPVHGGLQAGQGYFHKSALDEVFNGSREDGWRDVEVFRADLLAVFPATAMPPVVQGGNVPANRQLSHDDIIREAASMRTARTGISKGSAAASIVAGLPPNPKTGKPRDTRHIERIIAHLWEGGLSQSPP